MGWQKSINWFGYLIACHTKSAHSISSWGGILRSRENAENECKQKGKLTQKQGRYSPQRTPKERVQKKPATPVFARNPATMTASINAKELDVQRQAHPEQAGMHVYKLIEKLRTS